MITEIVKANESHIEELNDLGMAVGWDTDFGQADFDKDYYFSMLGHDGVIHALVILSEIRAGVLDSHILKRPGFSSFEFKRKCETITQWLAARTDYICIVGFIDKDNKAAIMSANRIGLERVAEVGNHVFLKRDL